MRTVLDQIGMRVSFEPDRPAIVLPDRLITYASLWTQIESVQRVIRQLELSRDEPVGLVIDNPARHLIVLLALLKSGYTYSSLRANMIDVATAFGLRRFMGDETLPHRSDIESIRVDETWFSDRARSTSGSLDVALEPNRIAQIAFSSGSTGRPKALARSWETFNKRTFFKHLVGVGASQKFMSTLGLSGSAANDILRVLLDGNATYFAPLESALGMIMYCGIEEVRCSASQANHLLEQKRQLSVDVRLKVISPGSAPLSNAAAEELTQAFHCEILNTYASTEAGVMALAGGRVMRLRPQKGNCFTPFAEIEIVDDAGHALPSGAQGRIRVRSETMSWPYTGNLYEVDDIKGDGWFFPGDIGFMDDDGLLVVTGRADEMINAGGVKYSPELMEDALRRHPFLIAAAVVKMTGASGVAEPWVAVVSRQEMSVTDLNRWVAQNTSGELAIAQFARLVRVEEIPLTSSGKIARQELRSRLSALAAQS